MAGVGVLLTVRVQGQTFAPFPIATSGATSQVGISAAFSGSNYLVGIQGDGVSNSKITAQLISTNGTLIGSRIAIGRTGGIPYVTSGGTNFLVVWPDDALVAGGGNDQVYGQFISRSGALVGSPFTFGPTSEEQNMQGGGGSGGGSLLAFDGKNYLAVWDTALPNTSSGDVHGVIFSQIGTPVVSGIPITSGAFEATQPAVTFGKTNYLVVWNNRRSNANELYDIYGEFISTNGTLGSQFAISQTPTPRYNPCCVAFDGTNFMVVWNKDISGGSPNSAVWNLYGRVVSPNGTFPGNEVAMVADANNPVIPSLASDGADYLLSWLAYSSSQVMFQFFNPAVNSVGPEFTVFSPQGANAPVFGGVLFDGKRFEITTIIGGVSGKTSEGLSFTSGTGTWGAFLSTITVATTSLPNGTNGVAYHQTLVAAGGQTPYIWTNISGALPPGLTLTANGLISGTPTTNGMFNFAVKVTDAASSMAVQALTLTVGSPPSVTLQPTNNEVTVTVGSFVTFSVSVAGTGPFSYQWQLNGTNFSNGPGSIITTVAGRNLDDLGDGGPATNATLNNPLAVAADANGNWYIADSNNNRVRKVGTNGIITTIAGNGTSGYAGDGGAGTNAALNSPGGVAVDTMGNLFIADTYNSVVRKVGTNGIITTVAGKGTNGYSGDGECSDQCCIK